jgi:hypothetical protein
MLNWIVYAEYSEHLKTGQVRIWNGLFVYGSQMVQFSNGILA